MKTKLLFLMTLFAALSIQCTTDSGEMEEIPAIQTIQDENTADEPGGGDDSPVLRERPVFFDNGYTNVANARTVVKSIKTFNVAAEYEAFVFYLQRNGPITPGTVESSKTNEIFLDSTGKVFVKNPQYSVYSLLCVSDAWSTLYMNQWDLEYSITQVSGQPDEIKISGTGRGSHIWDQYWDNPDAYETAEVTFEYSGLQIEGTRDFQGTFTLIEISSYPQYNFSITGDLTLERD